MSTETISENTIYSYLSFKLGDELFALGVDRVIEILEVPKITKIPRAPGYMTGVINLRGNVLPLVDTRIKFGMTPLEFTINTCIVVIEIEIGGEAIRLGILVDAVLEVLEVDETTMQSSPSIDAKYRLEFIKGMVNVQESFIMLLNIDQVFTLENIEQLKVSTSDITDKTDTEVKTKGTAKKKKK